MGAYYKIKSTRAHSRTGASKYDLTNRGTVDHSADLQIFLQTILSYSTS